MAAAEKRTREAIEELERGKGTVCQSFEDYLKAVASPLIDPDWREQPMRPWSEVYEELHCEVEHVYGLNDI